MRQLRTTGETIAVEMEIYSECKYTAGAEVFKNRKVVRYEGVTEWEIVSDEDAQEIEAQGLVDDNHEYLILHFEDGDTATFRNSYADMFKVW